MDQRPPQRMERVPLILSLVGVPAGRCGRRCTTADSDGLPNGGPSPCAVSNTVCFGCYFRQEARGSGPRARVGQAALQRPRKGKGVKLAADPLAVLLFLLRGVPVVFNKTRPQALIRFIKLKYKNFVNHLHGVLNVVEK